MSKKSAHAKISVVKESTKQPFLYKYRFQIGYLFLIITFFALVSYLPNIANSGFTIKEISSAVTSSSLSSDFINTGSVINLPYYLLQKACMSIFGLNLISVKLPSIIIGSLTALFITLLINRWFKSDVAMFGSILTVLSTAFLFLTTSGEPTIMYIFWLTLILWLGSKIVGNNNPHPLLVISFFFSVAASLYTPHLCYIAIAIALAGFTHPHLRFAMKQIKPWQSILSIAVFILTILPLGVSIFSNQWLLQDLFFMKDFSFGQFFTNISEAFAPFFSFSLTFDSVYLAPLFGLATVALVFIGTFAAVGELFTSRNTVISLIIIFSIIFSGFNQDVAMLIIIPVAILSAAGIESIFKKWYTLFPENPYAHFIGNIPVLAVTLMIIISGLSHYIYGYRYTPNVAKNFNTDILLIKDLPSGTILVVEEDNNFDFYKLFEKYQSITVVSKAPDVINSDVAYLGTASDDERLALKQIITSSRMQKSDRLYIYEKVPDKTQGE